ncbi:MAG: hypothetical protein LBS81_00025 [Endomicrobium sp.]|jgi:hypothetical protein|nr:hypothetical protein [Endomicrobium sp.]
MTNTVDSPDFNKSILIVIAMKPSRILNTLKLNKIYLMDNNVYAEYGIEPFSAQESGYLVSNMQVLA